MTIEIHNPELQSLLNQSMASGQFPSVEQALLEALRATAPRPSTVNPDLKQSTPPRHLAELFAELRNLLDGEDLHIPRDDSPMRAIDLS
jgi:hypothetical protein